MSIVSGIVGASASKSAARTQASAAQRAAELQLQATRESIAFQKAQAEQARADVAPWMEAGKNALGQLVDKISEGPGDYTKSPGYDFRLNEGIKAYEASASARGNLLSGAESKAIERYGQEYAANDYDNFLRRYYDSLTPLQSLSGVGQTSASQSANIATNLGTNVAGNSIQSAMMAGQSGMSAANAIAGGQINAANAFTGASRSGVNNALYGYDLWKQNQGTNTAANAVAADAAKNYLSDEVYGYYLI